MAVGPLAALDVTVLVKSKVDTLVGAAVAAVIIHAMAVAVAALIPATDAEVVATISPSHYPNLPVLNPHNPARLSN